jgi:hypothetical protein
MDADQLAKQAADRVREVIAEAERQAEEILADARAEAERIRNQAEGQARERVDAARKALEQLEGDLGGAPNPLADDPQTPETAQAGPEAAVAPPEPAIEPKPASDEQGARLVAMKLALDGKPRAEVAKQLRDEFGLEDTDTLVSDVFKRAGK